MSQWAEFLSTGGMVEHLGGGQHVQGTPWRVHPTKYDAEHDGALGGSMEGATQGHSTSATWEGHTTSATVAKRGENSLASTWHIRAWGGGTELDPSARHDEEIRHPVRE